MEERINGGEVEERKKGKEIGVSELGLFCRLFLKL